MLSYNIHFNQAKFSFHCAFFIMAFDSEPATLTTTLAVTHKKLKGSIKIILMKHDE